MNHYYLIIWLHYYLLLSTCNCLQSHALSVDFDNNTSTNTNNRSVTNEPCHRTLRYPEIVQLLSRSTCLQIAKKTEGDNNNRTKRYVTAGNIDVHALQTTINNQQTMINYLFNNSINTTNVADAIDKHHSRTGPTLKSWRDLVDLLFLGLVLIIFIYLLLCRAGFSLCDSAIVFLFRPVIARLQQQQPKRQNASVFATSAKETVLKNRTRPISPVNSIFGDGTQNNHA